MDFNKKNLTDLKKSNKSIPPLIDDDNVVEIDRDKAELFNKYFSMQSNLNDSNVNTPDLDIMHDFELTDIELTDGQVRDILQTLDISKAIGPDMINPRLLKEAANILCKPLSRLFNMSLNQCKYPSDWKNANVVPVFKTNNPNNVKNYRPISLISVIGKVMERCVYKHVHNFLVDKNVITSFQSGFTKNDSAVNQLLDITNDFGRALDQGKEIRVVFCDISKAFDRVWHKGLLYKLKKYGIKGNLLRWFENYLLDRQQRVVINGSESPWIGIKAGVPQGSILGPLLFLVFINDIVSDINCNIRLFADDTTLYLIVDDPLDASRLINNDLEKIHKWSIDWLVTFNPQKTESMLISKKRNKPQHPPLIMNNVILQSVTEHKHLGLILTENGSWDKHIDLVISKSFKRLNVLRNFKFKLNRTCLEHIYFTFIRPVVEYADIVWDNKTVSLVNKIEAIQIEAARIVTGGDQVDFN